MAQRDSSPATNPAAARLDGSDPCSPQGDAALLEAVAGLPVRRHGRPPADPVLAARRDEADRRAGVTPDPRAPTGHPLALAMASALRHEPEAGVRRLLNVLRRQQPQGLEDLTELQRQGIDSYLLFASESPRRQSKTEYKAWWTGHQLRGELLSLDRLLNHLGGPGRSWDEVKRRAQEAIRYDPLARRLTQAHGARQPLEVLLPLRAWATRLAGPLRMQDFLAWYEDAPSAPGSGWDRRHKLTRHHFEMLGGWPAALAQVGCAGREARAMQGAVDAEPVGVLHPELIDPDAIAPADERARAKQELWRERTIALVARCLPRAWAQCSSGGWLSEDTYNGWARQERVALAALGQHMLVPSASTIVRAYGSWPLALLHLGLISPHRAASITGKGRDIDHGRLVHFLYWALLERGPRLRAVDYEAWCEGLIDLHWTVHRQLLCPPSVRSITRHLGGGSWPRARTRALRGLRKNGLAPDDYPFPAAIDELEVLPA